eukprot:7231520-Prymnesium_polylepis.1
MTAGDMRIARGAGCGGTTERIWCDCGGLLAAVPLVLLSPQSSELTHDSVLSPSQTCRKREGGAPSV